MKRIIFSPLWSIIVLGILAWVMYINPPFLESLKLRYFDTLIVNQQAVENNIYTVNIDESSLEEYGQWPWPRGDYGSLIEELYARGAGLVVFNVLMSETDRQGEDIPVSSSKNSFISASEINFILMSCCFFSFWIRRKNAYHDICVK